MSDSESFAARWSRLKRETEKSKKAEAKLPSSDEPRKPAPVADGEGAPASSKPGEAGEPPFDPATLPSIDSIVAGSDIRAFLQSGVPAELTKAALRRAWTTDPAIRDFIEMAENQWDFTDPTSIPGFGPLQAGDDIGQLVAQAMGKLPESPELPPASMAAATHETSPAATVASTAENPQVSGIPQRFGSETDTEAPVKARDDADIVASHHVDRPDRTSGRNRRGHGGAMPK